MGRRLVIEQDTSPGQELADAIIAGQERAIGDLAYLLANQVSGLVAKPGEPPELHGDETTIISSLVGEYSAVSGAVGPRLCFMAAEPVLRRHPHLVIPAFEGLVGTPDEATGKRKRWFGRA